MSLNLLFAAHPVPPTQGRVGNLPIDYLSRLGGGGVGAIVSLAPLGLNFNARLTRVEVRQICRDPGPTPEAKYACAMAPRDLHMDRLSNQG